MDRRHRQEPGLGVDMDRQFLVESQPSGGQFYMAMYMGYFGAWRDLDYDDSRGFICQIMP